MPIGVRPFDPAGWLFWCEGCETQRAGRLTEEHDALTGEEYFELACAACNRVLLTMERRPEGAIPDPPSGAARKIPYL
jgi:hypothetical protein